jgi:rfaE bifunctional protein nucleotidyltransferase chain/domain
MVYQTIEELKKQIAIWKSNGDKVIFTNGVFDILHVGHVDYLETSAKLGDKLIVGINDDNSVRRLNKGPERPIHDELARARVVAGLRSVAATIIFGQDTPLELITALQPDILVKGGDYDPDETDESSKTFMVGSKQVRANGGDVKVIPLTDGYSTTKAVSKMKGSA